MMREEWDPVQGGSPRELLDDLAARLLSTMGGSLPSHASRRIRFSDIA